MTNFILFFNTTLSYLLVLIVTAIVIFAGIKIGIYWSKKNDEKAQRLLEDQQAASFAGQDTEASVKSDK